MQIIEDRRALHRIPELEHSLSETFRYLENALSHLGCQVFALEGNGLFAWFDFGQPDAIAFRADADALPIPERTGLDFASTHPGAMHACGHDGHMAILLELARRLDRKASLPHNVLLVFQPAEETIGGAKDICDTGIFGKYHVQAIFGLHLWPGLEKGVIHSRKGELMARSCEVDIDILGKSSHIAKAKEGIDALAAAVELYQRATAMERAIPEGIFRLLKFGKLESGTARNAISAHTHMEGSLRAFQDEIFSEMQDRLTQICRDVEASFGCTVKLHMNSGYPAVMNPEGLYDRVAAVLPFQALEEPSMTAEDFSWYQRYLPGMFFFLGLGDTPPLHADTFDFDESILSKGADFFEALAETFP